MNVLVIGATGPLGLEIVRSAAKAQHRVTAMVRAEKTASFPADVRQVRGDVLNRESLLEALRGQDAVISSLGSKISFKPITLLSEGTRNIVESMQSAGVRRLICITGIGAGDSKGHGGFLYDKIIQPLLLREVYNDKTRQERVVDSSGLDWTIVRPAQLTNAAARGRAAYKAYTTLDGVTAAKITRADVAEFTVGLLTTSEFLKKKVLLTY